MFSVSKYLSSSCFIFRKNCSCIWYFNY